MSGKQGMYLFGGGFVVASLAVGINTVGGLLIIAAGMLIIGLMGWATNV